MAVGDRTKRWAMPAFSARPLAALGFAPDQLLVALAVGGVAGYTWSWQVAAAVVLVLLVVVASYRQVVRRHPIGGDYEVARTQLGPRAAVVVGSSLIVDHVLTVAVTTAVAAQYAAGALDVLQGHEAWCAAGATVVIALVNLRPAERVGWWLALPSYALVVGLAALVVVGLVREYAGAGLPDAPSADLEIVVDDARFVDGLGGAALAFLLLRAFGAGSALLSGVQALAAHAGDCPSPRTRTAPHLLALVGALLGALGLGLVLLATLTDVRVAGDPQRQLVGADGAPVPREFEPDPLVGQLGESVFNGFAPAAWLLVLAMAAVLLGAAHLSFRAFPRLGLVLAEDRYAPQPLASRGDRLTHRNAVVLLAVLAAGTVVAFGADVERLVPLYLIGVFVVLALTQVGMARHWTRQLRTTRDRNARRRLQRDRAVNLVGVAAAVVVLVVVLVARGGDGAWLPAGLIIVLTVAMLVLGRHYGRVARDVVDAEADSGAPTRVHALVLGDRAEALAHSYARAPRPEALEVLTGADPAEVLAAVARARQANPQGVVEVYVTEGGLARWWPFAAERRLTRRMLRVPGVMVTAVPRPRAGRP